MSQDQPGPAGRKRAARNVPTEENEDNGRIAPYNSPEPETNEENNEDLVQNDAEEVSEDATLFETHRKNFYNAIQEYDHIKALGCIEELIKVVLAYPELEDDLYNIAMTLRFELQVDLKYEDMITTQAARRLSDITLFFLNNIFRKITFFKWFPAGRTLLTPHRRRQLMKTMNAEPRCFVLGSNSEGCLGIPEQNDFYVSAPEESLLPAPVYKMKTSGRHTVFWCHPDQFYGCGYTKNFMVRNGPLYTTKPELLDFSARIGERITGFRTLEFGTLFESEKRLYFIGDYAQSHEYLSNLHKGQYEPIDNQNICPNLSVCHTRPKRSIMDDWLDDPKNVAPVKFKTQMLLIRVFPTYWTELTSCTISRRPIVFTLNGIEMRNVRVQQVRSGIVWVIYEGLLYHGEMRLMKHFVHTDDESDLDNYVLFVDLEEQRTHSPHVVTALTSFDDTLVFKNGDYPYVSFDHFALREERAVRYVHNFMFEMLEEYMFAEKEGPNLEDISVDSVCDQARIIMESEQMKRPLEMDNFNRLEEKSRFANYFGFLCYGSMPRTSDRPPKFFDTDIDELTINTDPKIVARHRMKQLFEEFERVNYPGTDVWKPTEFLIEHPDPEDDQLTEGNFRTVVMSWCLKQFFDQITHDSSFQSNDFNDPINTLIVNYLMHILLYAQDLISNTTDDASNRDLLATIAEKFDRRVPNDNVPIITCMDAGAIFESRVAQGYLKSEDLEMEKEITLKFLLHHEDPELKDTYFEMKTFQSLIQGQNRFLLDYVDSDGVLDLNKVYPQDYRLHRLIAQTHFMGHGVTDVAGALKYETTNLRKLNWYIKRSETFLKNRKPHSRGYFLCLYGGEPGNTLVSENQEPGLTYPVTCACGSVIYCHPILPTLYSMAPNDTPLPPTLEKRLMILALRGIYDRKIIETEPIAVRSEIVDWYQEASMPEAFLDLLRICVIDAKTSEFKEIREFMEKWPVLVERFIAEHRPGILLWFHIPVPRPRLEHIKIITGMWPKNEFDRATRIPKKFYYENGVKKLSDFHTIDMREMSSYYKNGEERERPILDDYYFRDFIRPLCDETDSSDEEEEDEVVVLNPKERQDLKKTAATEDNEFMEEELTKQKEALEKYEMDEFGLRTELAGCKIQNGAEAGTSEETNGVNGSGAH